jgi:flagellar protein FliO/FliZ
LAESKTFTFFIQSCLFLIGLVFALCLPVYSAQEVVSSELEIEQTSTVVTEDKPKNSARQSIFTSTNEQKNFTGAGDALTVSLGLIFILLLIFFLAWFMKKLGYSNISGQGQLQMLATLNLGQKEKIVLLQVGKQQLLVGITPNQINTLHVLDEHIDNSSTTEQNAVNENHGLNKNNFARKLSEHLIKNKT